MMQCRSSSLGRGLACWRISTFLFLGYSGRIGRLVYWVSLLALGLAQFGAIWGLVLLAAPGLESIVVDPNHLTEAALNEIVMRLVLPGAMVAVLFLYPTYAVTTKRWHDRGKSGWWSLIGFVPIIGGLWMLIECGFLGGSDGDNYYGADPAYA